LRVIPSFINYECTSFEFEENQTWHSFSRCSMKNQQG